MEKLVILKADDGTECNCKADHHNHHRDDFCMSLAEFDVAMYPNGDKYDHKTASLCRACLDCFVSAIH